MSEDNKAKLPPAWEDPEVVAYQFTRTAGSNDTHFMRPLQLGLKGKELGVDANAINAGIANRTFSAFALPKGGMIVKVNTYQAEATTVA